MSPVCSPVGSPVGRERETDRYYLPPEDVRTELLTPSDTSTHC
ncbi:DUF427 domain-containing protein, partial [Streptomyces microflavus]